MILRSAYMVLDRHAQPYCVTKVATLFYDRPHILRTNTRKKWHQVHIIANYGGKVVFAYFEKLGLFNLPGGHLEEGENVDTTLRRELAEETGGLVIDWEPIGYQVRTDSTGNSVYQLRVYADVTGVKEQNIDFDGSKVSTKLVSFDEMLKVWGWENPIGYRIIDLVESKFLATNSETSFLESYEY